MSIRNAAQQLLRWSSDRGLLSDGALLVGDDQHIGYAPPQIAGEGVSVLRKRQVRYVGFNESEETLYVFLRRVSPTVREIANLPNEYLGYRVLYRQGNPLDVNGHPAQPHSSTTVIVRDTGAGRFFTCGSSISIGNERSAGTLGALCRNENGQMMGLSNCHVVGGSGQAPIGIPIVGPGVSDVCPANINPVCLGRFDRAGCIHPGDQTQVDPDLNKDCAAFLVHDQSLVSSFQGDQYDTPSVTAMIVPGMIVEKVGRTTGHTTGQVICEVVGALPIQFSNTYYGFSGAVYFTPVFQVHGFHDTFSEPGDSGSLVTTVGNDGVRYAVGLVFAGGSDALAPGGISSYMIPIQPCLDELRLSLISGHNI